MSNDNDPRFLALLVHSGLLDAETMRAAMESGNPKQHLLDTGAVTAEQWQEWQHTEAGSRPELSRYELGDLLGEGGTARVFRARDRKTGETVALKVLKPSLAAERHALEAFVHESKTLIDLECPHIVKGIRVAKEGDVFFCAMECVEDLWIVLLARQRPGFAAQAFAHFHRVRVRRSAGEACQQPGAKRRMRVAECIPRLLEQR